MSWAIQFPSSISVLVWIVFAASCFPAWAAISSPSLNITKTDDALFSCPIPNVGWDLGTALFKALQTRAGKKPCAGTDAHHTLFMDLMGSISYSSYTNFCSSRNYSQALEYWDSHFWWSLVAQCVGGSGQVHGQCAPAFSLLKTLLNSCVSNHKTLIPKKTLLLWEKKLIKKVIKNLILGIEGKALTKWNR